MFKAFLKKLFRPRVASGVFVGRRRTRDISFLAQSPVGFIGRITRSVPAPRITPDPQDVTNPVASYGLAVMQTAQNTVRSVLATDAGAAGIAGIAVANYPFQISSGTNYGAQSFAALTACPASGIIDTNRSGFQMVYCNSAQSPTATKADKVYTWCAASNGTHIQGGFENAASATVASAAKAGGNTGTGTVSAGPTVQAANASNGVYQVRFTDATHFNVVDPNGRQLQPGTTAAAYLDGIGFTITAGGTAFVAGDGFDVTVTMQTVPVNGYFNGPGDSTGAIELAFNL